VHAGVEVSLTDETSPLVNGCDLLAGFCEIFYLPLSHLTLSVRGSLRVVGFIFGMGKLEWLGYNLVGR